MNSAWSPDARYIATGDQDRTVHFWIVARAKDLEMTGYPTKVRELAWSADAQLLATGGGAEVTIWNCSRRGPRGTEPLCLEGHEDKMNALAFSCTGMLASGSDDGEVRFWKPSQDTGTCSRCEMPAPVTKIAWSDDGALPAIGNANGELHCTAGVFFAIGHSAMVMSLAVLFSVVSVTVIGRAHWLEVTGSWLSILILLAIAAINIRALLGAQLRPVGAKTRLLPRVLRDARNPLVALPIGLLFGLGFETSSQLAAYGASLSSGGGAIAGAIIGVAFCAGLVVTDAIDGFLVHYIVAHRASGLPAVARLWLWIVTIFAIAVACYEIAPYLGFHANEQSDLTFGLSLIAVLVLSFAGVFIAIRVHSLRCRAPM